MPAEQLTIRRARPADLGALGAIERAAAALFHATPYAWLADDDDLMSAGTDLERDHVWVAVDAADQPIGFAIAHLHADGTAHLHELDVHPRYARQGLGRRLIATVADWARAQSAPALTLTTFADVPWNGPYYARLGFRTLDPAALGPALQAVRQGEAEAGLPMAQRICMQLNLAEEPAMNGGSQLAQPQRAYQIVGLGYVSLYTHDFDAARAFYSQVFGEPDSISTSGTILGWRVGGTWLTLLHSSSGSAPGSNPRGTEFAIQVAIPAEVDALYAALLAAGARACMVPADTAMYESMRFACVDDPFGVRIDVYCPLPVAAEAVAALYHQLLASWNRRDAAGFAAPLAEDVRMVGFDGSEMQGRAEVTATIGGIFTHHETGAYLGLVREVRMLGPDTALLRAATGIVPAGQSDLNPALNAIQSLVATRGKAGWQITLFQNTPAQLHGRPELAAQLTAELRAQLGQGAVLLRNVGLADLPIFYEQQRDPEASAMAGFPMREHDAFMTHWEQNVLPNPGGAKQAILVGGLVAGNIVCFEHEGRCEVGYWLGRRFWGQGIASRALMLFLEQVATRPLYGYVVRHNLASQRVLAKCGFVPVSEDAEGLLLALQQ